MLQKDPKQNNVSNRLVLGTAQLGMPYGIANRIGKPNRKTAISILEVAWENGIQEFDTAQVYGESEEIIGQALASLGITKCVRIITKLHPNLNYFEPKAIEYALQNSLNRLQMSQIYGLLIHREDLMDLFDKGLRDTLLNLRKKGHIQHIGVSIYSPERALKALDTDIIEIIQIPGNMLDHRFVNMGFFGMARERKKKVYVRSLFLQGFLLMEINRLPKHMEFAKQILVQLDRLGMEFGLTRPEMALLYGKMKYPDARIVFGAESVNQIKSNISIWKKDLPRGFILQVEKKFKDVDPRIINPLLWKEGV